MERTRLSILSSIVLLTALAGILPAQPSVVWTSDIRIATSAEAGGAHLKIHAETVGQVDIVWLGSDAFPHYSQISQGELAIDAELIMGSYAHSIMGIGRYGGIPRVGFNNFLNIVEYTRAADNFWLRRDTEYDTDNYSTPSGGYAVDPTTGLGGFIFKDPCHNIVYIHETSQGGAWEKIVLETQTGPSSAWGKYNDLIYTPDGDPIGAYKYQYEDPNGNPYYTCCNEFKAGKIDGPGPLNYVYVGFAYEYLDVTVVPDGNIYLVDDFVSNDSRLHMSADNGQTWTTLGSIPTGFYGDGRDYAVAVAPNESLAAVLASGRWEDPCTSGRNTLWLSEPNLATGQPLGAEWYTDPCWLPGAGGLDIPDIAFDPYGYLYVAYFSTGPEAGIHAWSAPCLLGRTAIWTAFTMTSICAPARNPTTMPSTVTAARYHLPAEIRGTRFLRRTSTRTATSTPLT